MIDILMIPSVSATVFSDAIDEPRGHKSRDPRRHLVTSSVAGHELPLQPPQPLRPFSFLSVDRSQDIFYRPRFDDNPTIFHILHGPEIPPAIKTRVEGDRL